MEQKALTVSVAMAVKNGLPYLEKQLHSIFPQLKEGDEIVLSLDQNDTETMPYLQANPSPFVRVVRADRAGVLPNFQNALSHCKNEIVFLADQDDVWLENKVDAVKNAFLQDEHLLLVMHDAKVVDKEENVLQESFFEMHGVCHGRQRNFLRNSFMGCCMAFRRTLLDVALPFPEKIPMHDQWLGMIAEEANAVAFLETPYLLWRRHGENASQTHHAPFFTMLSRRLALQKAWSRRKKAIRAFVKAHKQQHS